MTTVSFSKKNGKFQSFRVGGHSGYAEEGSDIVCAAISAMTMLTINTITERFTVPSDVSVDEENAVIDFSLRLLDERGCDLIAGLYHEMVALANDYPSFVRVIMK